MAGPQPPPRWPFPDPSNPRQHRPRVPCGRLFPFPSLPSSSSWPVHAAVFRTNSLVWPRAVLPVSWGVRAGAEVTRFSASTARACSESEGPDARRRAEQTEARTVAREDADADDAGPLVDLALQGSRVAYDESEHVDDLAAVVGRHAVPEARLAAECAQAPTDE